MGDVSSDARHAAILAAKTVSPFFSVVIPVFNRADALKEALTSVLAQSCGDFEIVVVDDGSTDNPKFVVEEFSDPRIRFHAQPNRGASAARNAGIDLARGKFVAFLDSDDHFLLHHLAAMRAQLEDTHNMAAFAPVILDRGQGRTMTKPPRGLNAGEDMANYLLCDRGFVPTDTLVVPRETAVRVRYDERVGLGDDKDFAIRLALDGCKFVFIEAPGAFYRDEYDESRLSSGRKGAALAQWIERLRPRIPSRAYHGCRGWIIAKGVAATNIFSALGLYLNALLRGCYRPRLAAVIFLQIVLPDRLYRALADGAISWRR